MTADIDTSTYQQKVGGSQGLVCMEWRGKLPLGIRCCERRRGMELAQGRLRGTWCDVQVNLFYECCNYGRCLKGGGEGAKGVVEFNSKRSTP